jgi:hypothetical protein
LKCIVVFLSDNNTLSDSLSSTLPQRPNEQADRAAAQTDMLAGVKAIIDELRRRSRPYQRSLVGFNGREPASAPVTLSGEQTTELL